MKLLLVMILILLILGLIGGPWMALPCAAAVFWMGMFNHLFVDRGEYWP